MALTEQKFQAQQDKLKDLADELSRLNAEFEKQKKVTGATDQELAQVDLDHLPQTLKEQMASAREQAARAGEARAAQAQAPDQPAGGKRPGSGRRGIIRL